MFAEHKLRKGGKLPDVDLEFNVHNAVVDQGQKTVYTFSNQPIGVPDDHRVVAVSIMTNRHGLGSGEQDKLINATIGGIGMNLLSTSDHSQPQSVMRIGWAKVPLDTTTDIEITFDGLGQSSTGGVTIQVYSFRYRNPDVIDIRAQYFPDGYLGEKNACELYDVNRGKGGVVLFNCSANNISKTELWTGSDTLVRDSYLNGEPTHSDPKNMNLHLLSSENTDVGSLIMYLSIHDPYGIFSASLNACVLSFRER